MKILLTVLLLVRYRGGVGIGKNKEIFPQFNNYFDDVFTLKDLLSLVERHN